MSNVARIGSTSFSASGGSFAEMRIYQRSLTAAQILDIYNGVTLPTIETPLTIGSSQYDQFGIDKVYAQATTSSTWGLKNTYEQILASLVTQVRLN
jgi:hypothetical protein